MALPLSRLLRVAAAVAVLAFPAAAHATNTGGVSPPSPTTRNGSESSTPTGGTAPTHATGSPVPKKHKKKKHKKKKPPPVKPPPVGPGDADVPSSYRALYHAAGDSQGVSWRILAAIGKNESDHGRSGMPGVHSGLNFANCCAGPMQMCTQSSCGKTWQAYAVDGNGDGTASVYDPADSIYAAAHLVHDLKNIFGNHPDLILAAYNAGPGNVMHYNGVPPFAETQAYVTAGLAYIATLTP